METRLKFVLSAIVVFFILAISVPTAIRGVTPITEEAEEAIKASRKAREAARRAREAEKKAKEKAKTPINLSGCWDKEGDTMIITQNGDQITATITNRRGVTRDYSATVAQNKLTLNYQFKDVTDFKTTTWESGEGPPMDILKQAFPLLASPHISYQLKLESDNKLIGTYFSGSVTWGSGGMMSFSTKPELSSVDRIESPVEWTKRLKLSSITITDETFRNELQEAMPGERFWVSAKGSVGCSDIVDRVRVSVYPEEAEESEWIEVELVETGLDTLEFHSSPEGILVAAEEEEKEGPEIIEPEPPIEVAGEEDEGGEGPPSASSYDPDTGITTASRRNPDGSRTITQTDKDGNIISQETLPPIGEGPPSASSYDPDTGITTASRRNPDGSRTVTRTDKKGKVISSETVGPRTRQEQQGQPETFPDAEDFKEVVGEEWAEELAEEETQPGEAPEIVERRLRELNAEIDRLNIELSSRRELHARIQTKPVPAYLRHYTDSAGSMFSRVEITEEPELAGNRFTHIKTEQLLSISAVLEELNKEIARIQQDLEKPYR